MAYLECVALADECVQVDQLLAQYGRLLLAELAVVHVRVELAVDVGEQAGGRDGLRPLRHAESEQVEPVLLQQHSLHA